MSSPQDYPFSSWAAYYDAFSASGCSDLYNQDYPVFAKYRDEYGCEIDMTIVTEFLAAGYDPQEGLDGFIEAMIKGERYNRELIGGVFPKIVNLFITKGAKVNLDKILTRHVSIDSDEYFEDEMIATARIKHLILNSLKIEDIIPNLDDILDMKIGWKSISPMYWEDIPSELIRLNFDTARFMAIKSNENF